MAAAPSPRPRLSRAPAAVDRRWARRRPGPGGPNGAERQPEHEPARVAAQGWGKRYPAPPAAREQIYDGREERQQRGDEHQLDGPALDRAGAEVDAGRRVAPELRALGQRGDEALGRTAEGTQVRGRRTSRASRGSRAARRPRSSSGSRRARRPPLAAPVRRTRAGRPDPRAAGARWRARVSRPSARGRARQGTRRSGRRRAGDVAGELQPRRPAPAQ